MLELLSLANAQPVAVPQLYPVPAIEQVVVPKHHGCENPTIPGDGTPGRTQGSGTR